MAKKKPIIERVKTFNDVCKEAGVKPVDYGTSADASDEERHLNTYRKLLLIVRVLNEGWKANFADSSEWKYYPWFWYTAGSGFSLYGVGITGTHSGVGARLCFKSRELAKHAATQFQDIYNEYLTLQ